MLGLRKVPVCEGKTAERFVSLIHVIDTPAGSQVECMAQLAVIFPLRWPIVLFEKHPKIAIRARDA
jgi:hypothetical protein